MGILVLKKFCYCIGLRTGCITIGILGIIGRAIFGVGNGILFWTYFVPIDDLHNWRTIACIANGLVGIAAAATLLQGALKNNKMTTNIYLYMASILVLLLFISMCLGISTLSGDTLKNLYKKEKCNEDCDKTVTFTIIVLTFDIIDFVCYAYFWICANSFLQELEQI